MVANRYCCRTVAACQQTAIRPLLAVHIRRYPTPRCRTAFSRLPFIHATTHCGRIALFGCAGDVFSGTLPALYALSRAWAGTRDNDVAGAVFDFTPRAGRCLCRLGRAARAFGCYAFPSNSIILSLPYALPGKLRRTRALTYSFLALASACYIADWAGNGTREEAVVWLERAGTGLAQAFRLQLTLKPILSTCLPCSFMNIHKLFRAGLPWLEHSRLRPSSAIYYIKAVGGRAQYAPPPGAVSHTHGVPATTAFAALSCIFSGRTWPRSDPGAISSARARLTS